MLFTSPQGKKSHNTSTKVGRETEILNRMTIRSIPTSGGRAATLFCSKEGWAIVAVSGCAMVTRRHCLGTTSSVLAMRCVL